MSSNGNRWEISSPTGNAPLKNQIWRIPSAGPPKRCSTRKASAPPRRCPRRTPRFVPCREVWAKSRIRAPGREHATACSTIPGADAATMTRSAPRPSVRCLHHPGNVGRAGIEGFVGAEARATARSRSGMVSVATTRAPRAAAQHGEDQADGALSQDQHDVAGLRIGFDNRFEAGVHRFDEAGPFEGDAVGNLLDAARDNPIHDADVLREAAAGGLESGRDADFLVAGALRVQLALAVETGPAGDVVERDHAVAGLVARDARADRGDYAGGFVAVDTRERRAGCTRSSSDRCGRCRRPPRGPGSRPGRSPARERAAPQRGSGRHRRRRASRPFSLESAVGKKISQRSAARTALAAQPHQASGRTCGCNAICQTMRGMREAARPHRAAD